MSAVPFGAGFAEVVLLILFGGGVGIPVGVPPEDEDMFLARLAPEQCLYYTTWAGMAKPDANSSNHTEQLLAEPEIQQLVSEVDRRLQRTLGRVAASSRDEKLSVAARVLPDLGRLLLTHAAAAYVADVQLGPGGVEVDAAAVFQLGDEADAAKGLLGELQGVLDIEAAQTVELEGATFQRLKIDPQAPLVTWGIKGDYLIIGMGDNAVESVLDQAQTDPPAWLTEVRERLPMERRSTLTYANLGRIIGIGASLADDPQVLSVIEAMGVKNLTSYEATSGLDANGFVGRSLVRVDGEPTGLLAVCAEEALKKEDLAGVPSDATIAFAVRLDAQRVLEEFIHLASRFGPRAAEDVQRGLDEIRSELGLDIRSDILRALGDVWHVSTSPADGGLMLGWTASVNVRDPRRLSATLNRMLGFVQASLSRGRRSPRIREFEFAGHNVYFLSVPDDDFPLAPAWCITDDQLLVAMFPQAIKARLSRGPDGSSLVDRPEVKALFGSDEGPMVLFYQDTRTLFELFYPILQIVARAGFGELQQQGIDVDVSLLPSTACIAKHLQPGVIAVSRTSRGFETVTRQTLPGSSVGATLPVSVALLLPAVQSAREAARRTQSMNHLKMLGLAMHNFHDTYKALPAAYNTDNQGQPLLSWRVHILPFIEGTALYDQFHLDEPWDSEHNRRLIAQMPAVYRSPNSKAEPGKTVYLALRHEKGVLVPPEQSQYEGQRKLGIGIRHITDGTSNTLLAVEANDDSAVIWTKPDDLEVNMDEPLRGLVGLRPGGFLAAICDGSVRFIAASIDKDVLRALMTRNGNEPARIP